MPILAPLLVQLVSWPLVGALVWRAARGRATPVAWVVVVLLGAYAISTLVGATAPEWARGLIGVMGVCVVMLFGLYPDGRFTPRWIVVPVAVEVALQAINLVTGFALETQPWWPWHFFVTLGLLGGQVYRYRRRSSIEERERTRWPMLAVLAMVFAYTLWGIVGVGLGLDQERGVSLGHVAHGAPRSWLRSRPVEAARRERGCRAPVVPPARLLSGDARNCHPGDPGARRGARRERRDTNLGSGCGGGHAHHSRGRDLSAGGGPVRVWTPTQPGARARGS